MYSYIVEYIFPIPTKTHKNDDSYVGPSDVNFSRLNQFPGVHLIILIFAAYAP